MLDDPFFPEEHDEPDDFKNEISQEEPAEEPPQREEYNIMRNSSYLEGKKWKMHPHQNKSRKDPIRTLRINQTKEIASPALKKKGKNQEIQQIKIVLIEKMTVSRKIFVGR